jgi:hypothetical protein
VLPMQALPRPHQHVAICFGTVRCTVHLSPPNCCVAVCVMGHGCDGMWRWLWQEVAGASVELLAAAE